MRMGRNVVVKRGHFVGWVFFDCSEAYLSLACIDSKGFIR